MGLLPRDIRDIRKMTKSELLQVERKLNKSMNNLYDGNIKDEVYLEYESTLNKKYHRVAKPEDVITVYVKEKSRIKKYIYDCEYCADAKFTRKVDKATGEDIDYYNGDCGQAQCKYQDAVKEDISNPKEDLFKKFLI